ncbi:hypothetical protein V1478_003215 [Vespula squamosa]|uniref:Uncharacterized protein n=1 Tax=Vespula squamosa TaxID=30214 RepID=A0ABD2BS26_VESSQ
MLLQKICQKRNSKRLCESNYEKYFLLNSLLLQSSFRRKRLEDVRKRDGTIEVSRIYLRWKDHSEATTINLSF